MVFEDLLVLIVHGPVGAGIPFLPIFWAFWTSTAGSTGLQDWVMSDFMIPPMMKIDRLGRGCASGRPIVFC